MSSLSHADINTASLPEGHWGPAVWQHMHVLAGSSKPSHHEKCQLIRKVCGDLPCPVCRKHSEIILNVLPPENFLDLVGFLWCFHNMVNVSTNKEPKFIYECRGRFDPDADT